MSQGFILIATTHPYYGRMAANLANSIKAAAPDAQIALVGDEAGMRHLNGAERGLFSHIIDTNADGGVAGAMHLRMELPRLSPFKETISIDVDTIWLPRANPNDVFALLHDRDFTIVNEGYTDLDSGEHNHSGYTHWADPKDIQAAYDLKGKLWMVRGEFMVFRKGETVTNLFKMAKSIIRKPKIEVQTLGGGVTDEFAFNIALNKLGIEPHEHKWQPALWPIMHTGGHYPPLHKITGYYAISFGAARLPHGSQKIYEQVGKAAAYKTGVAYRFPIEPKRNFLKERVKN